MRKIAQKLNPK